MSKFQNLTGQKFGRLTVIERAENKGKNTMWLCRCDCGNKTYVSRTHLKNGDIKSCGCLNSELSALRRKKYNHYEHKDGYYIGYSEQGDKFYIDECDYETINHIYWYKGRNGYFYGDNVKTKKLVLLHRVIMEVLNEPNIVIDHINHNKTDNRRSNLRKCTVKQNNLNTMKKVTNTSGCTGVSWDKSRNKWKSVIGYNHKTIHLGRFTNYDEAVKIRKQAEEKYFGEFAYKENTG